LGYIRQGVGEQALPVGLRSVLLCPKEVENDVVSVEGVLNRKGGVGVVSNELEGLNALLTLVR